MKWIATIATGLLLLLSFTADAQVNWLTVSKAEYDSAAQSLVLLHNDQQRVPLRRLDTLRIAVVSPGFTAFNHQLAAYAPAQFFPTLSEVPPNTFNLLLYLSTTSAAPASDQPQLLAWNARQQLLYLTFEEAPDTSRAPQSYSAHIHAPAATPLHQALAAQLLFGGIGAKSGQRLAYGPPALVGMNAQLLQDSIAALLQMGIDSGAFPGAQVLVAKAGKVIFHQAYGHHTYARQRPLRPDDLYDLASVSKITTGLPILMQLYGQGRFDLDAPLQQYLPAFRRSNKARLRFRDMLAHQARLRPWIPYWQHTLKKNGRFKWRTFKRDSSAHYPIRITDQLYLHHQYKKKIYKAIRRSKLNKEAGYRYSGLLFYLLPEITERLTGQPMERYLRTQFYDRLGAATLCFRPYRYFPRERMVPTEYDSLFRKQLIQGSVHDEGAAMMDGLSCNAGLFTTANDLVKLMQLYLNGGSYGGEVYMAPEAVEEFTRCQFCDQGNRRGLGFDKPLVEYHPQRSSTARAASGRSYGHSGFTGTFVWVDPEEELIYIFLSNRVHPSRDRRKIYQLNIRPRIHQILYDAIEK